MHLRAIQDSQNPIAELLKTQFRTNKSPVLFSFGLLRFTLSSLYELKTKILITVEKQSWNNDDYVHITTEERGFQYKERKKARVTFTKQIPKQERIGSEKN